MGKTALPSIRETAVLFYAGLISPLRFFQVPESLLDLAMSLTAFDVAVLAHLLP